MQKPKSFRNVLLNGLLCLLMVPGWSCSTSATRSVVAGNQQNSSSLPAPSPAQEIETVEPRKYAGTYQNATFGFSVIIPEGLIGKGEPEPQPQHGFVIALSSEDRATLSVSGTYNALLWKSRDEVYDHYYRYASEGAKSVTLLDRSEDSMGTLHAIRFTVRYVDAKTDLPRIRSEIISLRKCPTPDVEVINTIVLDTPEHRFAQDKLVMDELLRSWKALETCG